MSEKEKKREQSIRLFEALANVSPELLVRSEKREENKVIRLWGGRYGGYVAACLALLLVGGIGLYSMQYFDSVKSTENAMFLNGTSGGAAPGLQGGHEEQVAEAEPQAVGFDGMFADVGPEEREENHSEDSEQMTGEYAQNQLLESSKEEYQEGRSVEKNMESNALSDEVPLTEMSTVRGEAARQKVVACLSAEEMENMGSLAEYLPMSLPQGYAVSDTQVSVDESGNGNYVIVMKSQEGKVLKYRVSRSEESDGGSLEKSEEVSVIYAENLRSEQFEAEENKTIVVLYGDNVRVEVWGDYTLEILREIYPAAN